MLTARTRRELRSILIAATADGERVGFVPTMGALHEGHLRLVDSVRQRCDVVVMSVYVNPLQFGPAEDFTKYPRDLNADSSLASERGVDVMFAPGDSEMYASPQQVRVSAGALGAEWEGRVRPGHFDGVATVVAKLFNIVRPDVVAFGQKDLQQVAVVRALIENLNFPIELMEVGTVRESDGLALSSRNRYLDSDQRRTALALSEALNACARTFNSGEVSSDRIMRDGRAILESRPGIAVDYLAVVDRATFSATATATRGSAVIGAVRIGATRLIDNVIL